MQFQVAESLSAKTLCNATERITNDPGGDGGNCAGCKLVSAKVASMGN